MWQLQRSAKTPPPQPTNKIAQFWKNAKELARFYKDGTKLLWANHKHAKELREKESQGHVLSRSEFQLIHRSNKDFRKLVPFVITFIIVGEWIPLVVMFVPGLIPSTCITNAQLEKLRRKMYEKRNVMSQNVLESSKSIKAISKEDFANVNGMIRISKQFGPDFELQHIDRPHLKAYCKFMGLGHRFATKGMLIRRLQSHLDYLRRDDQLIAKDGVDSLVLPELQSAAEERGMRSVDVSETHLKRSLKYWISLHLRNPPFPQGLLIFSRIFLLNAKY
ncbi:hypothetical protein BZG36_03837 [Bifiguratus adelaidae]|uniref:Letm1 RBD domain-containing protein n=1 Tax=Bifiguratus adelaidae TaxID=1938954 RepID=A0A261XW76_9FUNG|nr:hypothetical protein BZG36_03837 [Bifiguratus adelaidae]